VELDVQLGSAGEINAHVRSVVDGQSDHAHHKQDHGHGEEVPLLPQEIYVGIAKKFHSQPFARSPNLPRGWSGAATCRRPRGWIKSSPARIGTLADAQVGSPNSLVP